MPKNYTQATSLGPVETGAKKPPGTNKNHERSVGKPHDNANSERVVVSGVRRVWGVLKYCPTGAVISTIKKLAREDFGDKLTVTRKFREGRFGRRDTWWFLLKGEEAVLVELESMWDKVAFQTNWKIQTCTMPQTSRSPSAAQLDESQNNIISSNDNSQQVEQNITINEESLTTSNAAEVNNEHLAEINLHQ